MATRRLSLPKFHNRISLYMGAAAGLTLTGISVYELIVNFRFIHLFSAVLGLALGAHCLDMIRYYQAHRIVRIIKTDTERLVYKRKDAKQNNR